MLPNREPADREPEPVRLRLAAFPGRGGPGYRQHRESPQRTLVEPLRRGVPTHHDGGPAVPDSFEVPSDECGRSVVGQLLLAWCEDPVTVSPATAERGSTLARACRDVPSGKPAREIRRRRGNAT
ncbi:hypothetical protein GCM10012275_09380 [Longimycelium tulufanense]|uniref:Uncharacterized protein n=1 Tax=Longimycelium tulufanense TaxID=907463 RepID=A0A8J3FTJ5_9PSEU|nr:hypothetical protein GCM10012275_09380 [Longimycelium tulufanense]